MSLKRLFTGVCCIFYFMTLNTSPAMAGNTGKLYVVGMGPAGPDLTAPRALSIVEKADVLLCSPRMPQRFSAFGHTIDPSKIAFDPWQRVFGNDSKNLKQTHPKAYAEELDRRRSEVQAFLLEKINEGKTVVMMDGGDPCVYGPSLEYILKGFDDRLFEVIPGMGAVNAAAAALKRPLTMEDTRFVMLASFESLFGEGPEPHDDMIKDLSKYKSTLVLYMSIRSMQTLTDRLGKYYPDDLPVAVVYFAGYPDKENVVKGTLTTIAERVKKIDEAWLGLVIIGEPAR
ncbi:precorrin-4 C(11)-methyltransferase [Desulfatiferula olefinivorans]